MNTTAQTHKFTRFITGEIVIFLITGFVPLVLALFLVTENYMALLLVGGTLVGLALFAKPVYCFWALFFSVFLMGGVISHFPQITTLRWGIVLLSLMLGVRALLEFSVGNNRNNAKFDRLLGLVMLFLFIGFTSSLINGISPTSLVVALKNFFQFAPVVFALAILPQFKSQSMVKKICLGLLVIALIQVPMALYQNFVLGKQLIAMGFFVTDAISGTFATSLKGGASNSLSLYLIFVSGILISSAKYKILLWRKAIALSLVLLVPILFNETKVSFVYIPVLFGILYRKELLRLGLKGILALLLCFMIIVSLGYTYKTLYTTSDQDFENYVKRSLEYNFGTRGYARYELNRLTVLSFWVEEQKRYDPSEILFGHGLDAANEGEGSLYGVKGHMAARYPALGIGLTMASRLLWETGIAGMACFFAILIAGYKRIGRFLQINEHLIGEFQKAVLLSLQAGIALCAIESFVSSDFRNQEVYNFLFFLIMGLTLMLTQTCEKK
jgi:hypothetical protein